MRKDTSIVPPLAIEILYGTLDFSDGALEGAEAGLQKLWNAYRNLRQEANRASSESREMPLPIDLVYACHPLVRPGFLGSPIHQLNGARQSCGMGCHASYHCFSIQIDDCGE